MLTAKTQGQVEDHLSKAISKFYARAIGIGPKQTRVYILEDMIIVRLLNQLLPIEVRLLENKNGINLVKDLRQALHESTVSAMSELIQREVGLKVVSSHSDISTKSGEILQVYILETNLEEKFNKLK